MSVLVTGGAGFIGSHLVRRLVKERANVIVLDDFSTGSRDSISDLDIGMFEGDVSKKDTLSQFEGVEYLFHFAAPSSIVLFQDDPARCMHRTVCGFVNVFEWAKSAGVRRVVYPSSGSVYGNIDPPHRETASPQPTNLYGVAKLCTEHIAKQYDSVRSVGLRIFAGYGLGENRKGKAASVVTLFLNSVLRNESPVVFGDGTQRRDYVYIDDITEAVLVAASGDFSGIVNVGTGRSYSFNEIVSILNRLLDKRVTPRYIAKPNAYLQHTLADTKLMSSILGVQPVDLETGLRRYLQSSEVL